MSKLNIDQLKKIILASVLVIVGIFFCCSLSMGINGLSVILGILILIIGIVFIVNSIINSKGLLSSNGILGVVIISLGIMFIAHKIAGLIFVYIPWFLIVLGVIILIDGFLGKFTKGEDNTNFIIKLVLGGVSIVLGLCLRLINGFAEYAALILGILLIIYGVYIIFINFIKNSN